MSAGSEVAERLALALNQAGMQRMTARVLAAFLFSERESVTAGELAEQLGVSAGSISPRSRCSAPWH